MAASWMNHTESSMLQQLYFCKENTWKICNTLDNGDRSDTERLQVRMHTAPAGLEACPADMLS